jgi:hypothetical protein
MRGRKSVSCPLIGAGKKGALLTCTDERWDEDKERIEQNVEDFPEDAARWTGEKVCALLSCLQTDADNHGYQVGEVERIPENIEQGWDRTEDRIENKWDNAVDDVEDFPENAAGWAGRKVGEVEQFGDNIDYAYDEGRAEGRDDW